MADGARQLEGMMRRVNLLAGIAERVAPRVGEVLRREADKAVAGQRSPTGTPWAPSKSGARVLESASRRSVVSVDGSRVSITLDGPDALHNDGRARGGVRRQILPSRTPAAVGDVVVDEWRRTMEGA